MQGCETGPDWCTSIPQASLNKLEAWNQKKTDRWSESGDGGATQGHNWRWECLFFLHTLPNNDCHRRFSIFRTQWNTFISTHQSYSDLLLFLMTCHKLHFVNLFCLMCIWVCVWLKTEDLCQQREQMVFMLEQHKHNPYRFKQSKLSCRLLRFGSKF